MPLRIFAVYCAFFVAGCSLFGDDDPEIQIRTDQSTYAADPGVTVSLRVENRSEDPIFYICTGQIFLEEISGGQVVGRWMIHGFEECLSPEPIDSDEVEVFELSFDNKSALGNLNDAVFDQSVDYRMTVDLFWDLAFNRPVSEEDRRSNGFKIIRSGTPGGALDPL